MSRAGSAAGAGARLGPACAVAGNARASTSAARSVALRRAPGCMPHLNGCNRGSKPRAAGAPRRAREPAWRPCWTRRTVPRMLVFGLTGGLASGKSTVAARFAARGVPVLDADVSARRVVEPGSDGLAEVVAAFGADLIDAQGALDRKALGARVFGDDASRRKLESML